MWNIKSKELRLDVKIPIRRLISANDKCNNSRLWGENRCELSQWNEQNFTPNYGKVVKERET